MIGVTKKQGTTRTVFLTQNYAIKIPSMKSWRFFLHGLLSNMQEKEWSGVDERLCPTYFSIPGGFLNIMPRVVEITYEDWIDLDTEKYLKDQYMILPVDNKYCSFGYLDGKLVAVDYGS